MSYPFALRFLVGRLLIEDKIEEKICIIQQEDDEEGEEEPNEIWSDDSLEPINLGMIEFQIGANRLTFEPEFRLLRKQNLFWQGRDGIKSVINGLDTDDNRIKSNVLSNIYRCYYILGSRPPPGIIHDLTKRLGKNLLERIDMEIKQGSKVYWCILLKSKANNMKPSVLNIRHNAFGDIFSSNENPKFGNSLNKDKYDFEVIGESLSTNCAEIEYVF